MLLKDNLQASHMKMHNHIFFYFSLLLLPFLVLLVFLMGNYLAEKSQKLKSENRLHLSDNLITTFTSDSLFRIECDTIARVIDNRSGKTVNEFPVYSSWFKQFPAIKQIEIDPSDKYLAVLDNYNLLSLYDLFSGELEGFTDYYYEGSHHVYFSDDNRFVLIVDYREATVDILRCPDLEFIADADMGFYRTCFFWENKNGKLIFYYESGDNQYMTLFPDDRFPDSLCFTEPAKSDKPFCLNSSNE